MTTMMATDERRWTLSHTPASVPEARAALVAFARSADVSEQVVGEAELAVSELLSNAVTHGSPDENGTVRMQARVRHGVVEISVTDGGDGPTRDVRPAPRSLAATRGRGLRIVRALAHEWGVIVDRDGGGTTVWASIGGPSRRRAGAPT